MLVRKGTDMKKQIQTYVGQGIYTVPEVSRLTGAPSPSIYNWLFGGSVSGYQKKKPLRNPALAHQFDLMNHIANVSFKDMIQVRFVQYFREQGVSLQTIRNAAHNASNLLATTHPFCSAEFKTDGTNLLAKVVEIDGEESLVELKNLQHVFKDIIDPFLTSLDYDEETVSRWWQDNEHSIVIDPSRNFGRPSLAKEGCPTVTIYEAYIANEKSAEVVSEWYEISIESVISAVQFEEKLAA